MAIRVTAEAESIKVGGIAPAFSLQDQDGRNVTLQEFINKTVVLEWFDSDCDFTRRDYKAKTMQTIADKYADKDVVWLAINSTRNSNPAANKKWAKDNELKYKVLDDANKAQAQAFGVDRVPVIIIVDKHGNVSYIGGVDNDESREGSKKEGKINYVDRALEEMTSGKSVTTPETRLLGCPLK